MTWRPRLNVVCARCGKPRGLQHECVSNRTRRPSPRLDIGFGKCPKCGKPLGNPLTHVCAPRSDFRRRKARYEREQQAAARKKRQQQAHDYTACMDQECPRPLCTAYRTGYQQGETDTWDVAWKTGYERGIEDCPRAHI